MSKIICDICGTSYPDTVDSCPICGYNRSGKLTRAPEVYFDEEPQEEYAAEPVRKPKAIFDFDEVNPDEEVPQEEYYQESPMEDYEEPPRHNTFLVILLVIVITLLLVGIGFLFFRFYLPNRPDKTPETQPQQTEVVENEPTVTTEPRIPCTSLALTSGVTELNREGQYWLLHVTVLPEDTTDVLTYSSEDEAVVTVNEQGRITAVGEGETNVYITCGEKQIKCRIVVAFTEEEETTAPQEGETVPNAVDHEALPEETAAPTEPEETTAPTEALKQVTLKLKKYDVSSGVKGITFTLELDCDLKPEEVTWFTMDSSIAIVKNGEVTTIGPGQTRIIAQYGDQQVECIVRCTF